MYVRTSFTEKVKLPAKDLHEDYVKSIHQRVKEKLEGKCTRFGYIQEGSVEPMEIHMGEVEAQTFRGFVVFDVRCAAHVCNPTVGSVIRARVVNMNNFGLLCMSIDDDRNRQVMDIIIPKDMKSVTSVVDVRQVKPNQIVEVQVIGKKYELYSTKIVVVGVIQKMEAATAASVSTKKKSATATSTPIPVVKDASVSAPVSRLLAFDDDDDFTFDDDADEEEDVDADADVEENQEEDAEADADADAEAAEAAEEEDEEEAKEDPDAKSKEDEEESEFAEEDSFNEDDEDDIHYSDDE